MTHGQTFIKALRERSGTLYSVRFDGPNGPGKAPVKASSKADAREFFIEVTGGDYEITDISA